MPETTFARDTIVDRIEHLFNHRGSEAYLGEAVSVSAHMLQCAALARSEQASDALVAAALLHDIGHLVDPSQHYSPEDEVDHRHEESGAAFLVDYFPAAVVTPIRLHVAAKRFLCAVDAGYAARLSAASRHSLGLQGGPMDETEVEAFTANPFHQDAISVRLWDDAGKVANCKFPAIEDYRGLLRALLA